MKKHSFARSMAVLMAVGALGLSGLSACSVVDPRGQSQGGQPIGGQNGGGQNDGGQDDGGQPQGGQLQGKYMMTVDAKPLIEEISFKLENNVSTEGYFVQFGGSQVLISEKEGPDLLEGQSCTGTYTITADNVLQIKITSGYIANESPDLVGTVDGDILNLNDAGGAGALLHIVGVAESAANKGLKFSGMFSLGQILDSAGNDITNGAENTRYFSFTWSTFRFVSDPLKSNEKDSNGLYSVTGTTVTLRYFNHDVFDVGQWNNNNHTIVFKNSDSGKTFIYG